MVALSEKAQSIGPIDPSRVDNTGYALKFAVFLLEGIADWQLGQTELSMLSSRIKRRCMTIPYRRGADSAELRFYF